jgi:hypothetical protein
MKSICTALGPTCEVVAAFPKKARSGSGGGIERSILAMVRRRPVTAFDIGASLGREPARIAEVLASLVAAGRLRSVPHGGKTYFEPF